MGLWWWVLIFAGIAVCALALFGLLGLSLWRKAKVLSADLGRLSAVAAEAEASIATAGGPTGSPPSAGGGRSETGDRPPSLHRRRRAG